MSVRKLMHWVAWMLVINTIVAALTGSLFTIAVAAGLVFLMRYTMHKFKVTVVPR